MWRRVHGGCSEGGHKDVVGGGWSMVDAVGAVTVDGVGGGGSMVDAVGAVTVVAVGGGSTAGDSFTQCIYQSVNVVYR